MSDRDTIIASVVLSVIAFLLMSWYSAEWRGYFAFGGEYCLLLIPLGTVAVILMRDAK